SYYIKVNGGYIRTDYNPGSFLSNSHSFLEEWGGSITGGLSTAGNLYDILVNGNHSTSNYFDLSINASTTAISLTGVGVALGIISAPAWVPAAAAIVGVAGTIYGIANVVSNLFSGKSLSQIWFR
ncbi:MAG: hypothetical protein M3Y85_05470, partial [Bacteroidota bacterium]|nr:hypothetical protein [Bacteroidota bacterium]